MWFSGVSREGIPWREYSWGHLLVSLVVAIPLDLFFFLVSLTTKVPPPQKKGEVAPGSILVVFHPEWPIFPITVRMWRRELPPICWVGLHHFLSYFGSLVCFIIGAQAIRFRRNDPEKPFYRIVKFIEAHPHHVFAIRTDSGGPYNQVRHSAIALALKAKRDIICLRQIPTRYLMIHHHYFALPFGRVDTHVSAPISHEKLATLSLDEARELVQATMDGLVTPSPAAGKA